MENETSKEPKAKVSYCGIEIPDFPLPENLSSFKEQLIEQFGEDKANKIMDMRLSKFKMVSNLEIEILDAIKDKFNIKKTI